MRKVRKLRGGTWRYTVTFCYESLRDSGGLRDRYVINGFRVINRRKP